MVFGYDDLAMGAVGVAGTLLQNDQASREAEKNRNFQERMSNTAHQREADDLEAAGINRLLTAGGSGASTPGGGQASVENVAQSGITSARENAQLKLAQKKNEAELGNMIKQGKLLDSQKNKTDVEAQVLKKGIPESDFKNEMYDFVKPAIRKGKEAVKSTIQDFKEFGNQIKMGLP